MTHDIKKKENNIKKSHVYTWWIFQVRKTFMQRQYLRKELNEIRSGKRTFHWRKQKPTVTGMEIKTEWKERTARDEGFQNKKITGYDLYF